MICCYNAARNDPYKESHHPRYTPLAKVADAAIVASGRASASRTRATSAGSIPNRDASARSLGDKRRG